MQFKLFASVVAFKQVQSTANVTANVMVATGLTHSATTMVVTKMLAHSKTAMAVADILAHSTFALTLPNVQNRFAATSTRVNSTSAEALASAGMPRLAE